MTLDLRYALRVLARSPGFTAIAVLSLGIGIGASTTMAGAIRAALRDPLPVASPEALRVVQWTSPAAMRVSQYNSSGSFDAAAQVETRTNVSYEMFRALERDAGDAATVAAFNFVPSMSVAVDGRPAEPAGGMMVSGSFFAVLRPGLQVGRFISPADDDLAAPPVAVFSHAFWRRVFQSDPTVVGRVVSINGSSFQVIGVAAAGFKGLSRGGRFTPLTDVFVPIAAQPRVWSPEDRPFFAAPTRLWLRLMARIETGREPEAARRLGSSLRQSSLATGIVPADKAGVVQVRLVPGAHGITTRTARGERPLLILSVVVGLVLLVTCVNLAGLMLARGVARRQELAVRRALGAGRLRLIKQLLAESVVLALAGGAAGLLLAAWFAPVASGMIAAGLGLAELDLPLDTRAVAWTMGIALIASLSAGLVPAIRLSGRDMNELRDRTSLGAPKLALGRVLMTVQVGLSVPLVVAAGLLLGTLQRLDRVTLGFDAGSLVLFRVDPAQDPEIKAARQTDTGAPVLLAFMQSLLDQLRGVPGVRAATLLENSLLSGWVSNTRAVIDGAEQTIHMNAVGPAFFDTVAMPILAGRGLELEDGLPGRRAVVINETAARLYFSGQPPIGRTFRYGTKDAEVVGVAADAKYSSLRADVVPTLYDPIPRRGLGAMFVALETDRPAGELEKPVRDAVARVSPNLPITEFKTQRDQIAESIGRERLIARLSTAFSGLTLLLACIGLYGVTAYTVARRTAELGVRLALGSTRGQVLWLVLRQSLVLAAAGVALGVPAAYLTSPLLESLLFGVLPHDVPTLAAAAATMLAVAACAGTLPAIRAARLEPLQALRA